MAGQTDRPTKPITSSDTINMLVNTVMPAIEEIKGDVKVIDEKVRNIEGDVRDVNGVIKQFRTTLYGNGNPEQGGLVSIVAQVQNWVGTRSKIEISVIGGVVVLVIGELIGFAYIATRLAALHP